MSPQHPGGQQRIEGVENSLVLAVTRDVLDHGTGKVQGMQLATQQCRQEPA
jgi:hypothetical protein